MASKESLSRIVQLANTISTSVRNIEEVLSAKGIASPSFDEDASFNIPLELNTHHDAVLDATAELHDLLLEPLNLIHRHGGHNNSLCMQAIAEFKMADLVPLKNQISFDDIASQTPLTSEMTARILRHAMTMRIFREPEPGMVAHTAASRTLSHSPANDWLAAGTKEMWPAATKMVEALHKWPASQEADETGYALSNDTQETIYQIFAKDTARASRWARGMQVFTERPQFNLSYVTDHYDWESLGPAQVVDVGGSQGHVSMALARKFKNLNVIVQDMERVVENATVPEDLQGRMRFMAHDIFTPQPVQGAEVYYLRWILHNWSDKYCLLILRALVPALKRGAKVIIQETLMPEPGTVALWKEKNLRATDLNMASAFNAKERTVTEFKSLLERSDPAFTLRRIIEPNGSALGMVEFFWEGTN
ncbi:S-adenosyl-L-methionine-dependent methyltransferase [Glarea lozoyensis ATCC 20868]|uniref:S-adenosyl-L-methionine-dependent methyltransferase n=1 Tax=Glarea lozoyensis (strain ATCC 20868 / MF5171) TaxID=1116229 RepID=S3D869_GLAL2|nr:S-adenosyl-L-methionine-dependent methyltransferase [Glarea lozoyensis ATCC 20868]EPE28206.1 S-adenosyl-L-methionine-dependent methyltransferase [Glarea lozoyensis ATCC 20868]